MKKRGLSMIVTSLIIILLVLVAIGILYVVYINFVRTGTEGISLGKFTIDLEIERAYVEDISVKVSVKRNPGKGDLIAINFVISDGDNSEVFREETTIQELGGGSFSLTPIELNIDDVETVSIAPIYLSDSGKEIIGDIIDTYNIRRDVGGGNGNGNGNGCTPDCAGKVCGDDGCSPYDETDCGTCTGIGEVCNVIEGTCIVCTPDCSSCAPDTCDDETCIEDTCNTTCDGTKAPDCGARVCGPAPNGCGNATSCGTCTGADICNSTGQCVAPENCTDNCTSFGYECGTWEICGNATDCGTCSLGFCNSTGQCYVTPANLTGGIIDNVWPPSGIYFDSGELPINISYINYWIRFTSGAEQGQCSLIFDYIFPPEEPTYNKSHIRLGETSTGIQTDDTFDIWNTFINCDTAGS